MNIKFSRHARRRAKLYHISEFAIMEIVETLNLKPGKHEIIKEIAGSKFPIKIVIDIGSDLITIITNYPYKKGRKR